MISSGTSALLPNQVSGNLAGSFGGPGAKEVGGVFGISGGQITAVGAFGGAGQTAPASSDLSGSFTAGNAAFGSGASGGSLAQPGRTTAAIDWNS